MATTPDDLTGRWLKGLMETCVLAVLSRRPAYGYEIAGWFEAAGLGRPKGGSLYPILGRLEASGLIKPTWVEGDGGPGRKYYQLTPDGTVAARAAAQEWDLFHQRITWLMTAPIQEKSA